MSAPYRRVKNRGFLIDLESDVEKAMLAQPNVTDARAFMVRGRLIGAVTPEHLDTRALRRNLLVKTPAYMVCNKIFALSTFPRTSNDKIDRRQLESLLEEALENEYETFGPPPTTDAEQAVAAGFSALFHTTKPFGVNASFLELGGDSLGAIRLVSHLLNAGYVVSFQDILISITVGAIAQVAIPTSSNTMSCSQPSQPDLVQARKILGPHTADDIEDIAPLTPAQRAMFMATAAKPFLYSLQTTMTLLDKSGPLNTIRFFDAWRYVVEKYSIFRSAFYVEDGVQIVHRRIPEPQWECYSLGSEAEMETELQAYLRDESRRRFDAEEFSVPGRLNRLALFTCPSSDLTSCVWTIHHGLIDGISARILNDALIQAYNVGASASTPLSASTASFASIAKSVTNQEQLFGEAASIFWKTHLAGVSPAAPLNLPSFTGDRVISACELIHESTLSLDLVSDFARSSSNTLSSVFLAAAAIVLCRYTNEPEVTLGVVLTGRSSLPSADQVVGPLVNTLPIRVDIGDGTCTVKELFNSISSQILSISKWEWSPLRAALTASGVPPFQSLFDFAFSFSDDFAAESIHHSELAGLRISSAVPTEQTEFPYSITFERSLKQNVAVRVRQQPQRLHPTYAENLARHFCNTVNSLITCELIKDVVLMDATEFRHLTHGMNSHHTEPFHPTTTILDRFETTVNTYGDLTAVSQMGESITYAELHKRSALVAYYLATHHGVTIGSTVAVYATQSIDWIVGVFGVLMVGGSYLAIDSKLPPARQSWLYQMGDNVGIILVPLVPDHDLFDTRLVKISDVIIANTPPLPLLRPGVGDVLAYVYTSGRSVKWHAARITSQISK
jgi:gliotoxin/aspirochlorine biosynthesis peptide synthetase